MPTILCRNEDEEITALLHLKCVSEDINRQSALPHRWVGWRNYSFDGPVLETRSRLLGLRDFGLDLRKYNSKNVLDLFLHTTFDGACGVEVMARHQKTIAKRFGIENPDPFDGGMVGEMVKAGRWDDIAAHCAADIAMTTALYRRLGFTTPAIVFDLETYPIDNVADYRAVVKPDGRVTDPKKVEASIDEKLTKAALDPYLCRIVCIGYEVVVGEAQKTDIGAAVEALF